VKTASIDKNEPLPLNAKVPTANDFMTLYRVLFAHGINPGLAKTYARVIILKEKLKPADALSMAIYLGMDRDALAPFIITVAEEVSHLKSALGPKNHNGIFADLLPPEIRELPPTILGTIFRTVYLAFSDEQERLRTHLRCHDVNDKFCLKTQSTALPMQPFSLLELIYWRKVASAQGTYVPAAPAQKLLSWDLTSRFIGDVSGVSELYPGGEKGIGRLRLGINKIALLPDNFLAGALGLEILDLDRNLLRQLPPNFLSANRRLHYLHLEGNQLQSLPENFMVDCGQLRTLNLQGNELRQFPENFLSVCPHIQQLHLENNFLSHEVVEQIRARLTAQGKVVDGVNIVLEPQRMEQDNPPAREPSPS